MLEAILHLCKNNVGKSTTQMINNRHSTILKLQAMLTTKKLSHFSFTQAVKLYFPTESKPVSIKKSARCLSSETYTRSISTFTGLLVLSNLKLKDSQAGVYWPATVWETYSFTRNKMTTDWEIHSHLYWWTTVWQIYRFTCSKRTTGFNTIKSQWAVHHHPPCLHSLRTLLSRLSSWICSLW